MRLKRRKEMPLLRAESCRSAMDSDSPAGVQATCSPAENRKKKGMLFNSYRSLFHSSGLTRLFTWTLCLKKAVSVCLDKRPLKPFHHPGVCINFFQTLPVQTGAQTQPVQTGAQTQPVQKGAKSPPVQTGAQTQPVQTGAQTQPVQKSAHIQPVQTVAHKTCPDKCSHTTCPQVHVSTCVSICVTQPVQTGAQTLPV